MSSPTSSKTPKAVIHCDVLRSDLLQLHTGNDGVSLLGCDQQLHLTPKAMPARIQERIDAAARDYEQIALGYGLCSNGIVGLRAPKQGLIVPKAHDCINLLFGSKQAYLDFFFAHPGSYFLLPELVLKQVDPLGVMEHSYLPKLGPEMAEWGMREELKSYERFVLLDTGAYPLEKLRPRAEENASCFRKELMVIKADLSLLQRILYGPYQEEDFLILAPGEEIEQSDLL